MSGLTKCDHGYFTHSPSNRCPWCFGFDDSHRDVIPVVGHGNGWLLRARESICTSCGGPGSAGWGMSVRSLGETPDGPTPSTCYSCRIGDNTKDALKRRAAHEATRGKKKPPARGSS